MYFYSSYFSQIIDSEGHRKELIEAQLILPRLRCCIGPRCEGKRGLQMPTKGGGGNFSSLQSTVLRGGGNNVLSSDAVGPEGIGSGSGSEMSSSKLTATRGGGCILFSSESTFFLNGGGGNISSSNFRDIREGGCSASSWSGVKLSFA
mmetsp:Transcript_18616/g.25630  ORF Transcript_18616/g.25630 Transcript_18616/m.25630 type:complete len:148 (-) Transcript_18616:45-488(-)